MRRKEGRKEEGISHRGKNALLSACCNNTGCVFLEKSFLYSNKKSFSFENSLLAGRADITEGTQGSEDTRDVKDIKATSRLTEQFYVSPPFFPPFLFEMRPLRECLLICFGV